MEQWLWPRNCSMCPLLPSPRFRGPVFAESAAESLGMEQGAWQVRTRDSQLLRDTAAEQRKTLRDPTNELGNSSDVGPVEAVDQHTIAPTGAACCLQQARQKIEHCLAGLGGQRSPWIQTDSQAVAG
jgi:hypothetical protein